MKGIRGPIFNLITFFLIVFGWPACTTDPSAPKSPKREHSTFQLDPGLRIELVASEPMIQDPVAITFDEDGRLWVVEMRGFMSDIDRTSEEGPVGRISVLIDRNNDGIMDESAVFLDSLILPRSIAIVKGGALVAENIPLWYVEDLDGDLKADRKTLVDSVYGGSGLPEHSGNGLWRGIDNWYYNAKSTYRYRNVDGQWIRDETEFRGQWGICHDDKGRLFYNYNWSQLHADLVPPNYFSRNVNHSPTTGIDHGLTVERRIFPIRPNTAVNRGYIPSVLDDEGRLLEFTAACAPFVYRGDAFPQEYYGNAFVCEPSGNLIKRNIVIEKELSLTSHFAYSDREFLASTDERFRPVFLSSGPDGTLYVVDMYRGIVQHGAYMTEYLREESLERKLDKPINLGRIWRIVPENWESPSPINLSSASSHQLVEILSHPNGWHRDMAQRLLVERRDNNVIAALEDIVRNGNAFLGRMHALWTLEGMEYRNPDVYFEALRDTHPYVRSAAIRILESIGLASEDVNERLAETLLRESKNTSPVLALQMALTAGSLPQSHATRVLELITDTYVDSAVIRDAILSSVQDEELTLLKSFYQKTEWQTHTPGREIFLEMLATAILRKGDPDELKSLLSFLSVPTAQFGWREKAVLTGITVYGNNKPGELIPLPEQPKIITRADEFDSAVHPRIFLIGAIFTWPGHSGPESLQQQVSPLSEVDQERYVFGRQHYLTLCASCHGPDGTGLTRFAPPLVNSEWVTGDEKRLVLLILHGMEGPLEVRGLHYDVPDILPVMPSLSVLDDKIIASILTYIRREWGHTSDPVKPSTVGRIRHTMQGRVMPWSAEELWEISSEVEEERIE